MQSQDEIASGIEFLKQQVVAQGLSVSDRELRDRRAHYFEITDKVKSFDFVLPNDFLMNIPATANHKAHIREYLSAILGRFHNYSPRDFLAKSGIPFSLKIDWPFKAHPNRDVIWCHVEVEDLRRPDMVAMTTPTIWLFVDDIEFQSRPLARIEAVVDAIRNALDRGELQFYRRTEHPSETQEVRISEKLVFSRLTDDSVEQFLASKVFWLGFKRGDQSTGVWIGDPWDATYLGVTPKELVRAAQVLQARGIVKLTPDNQIAVAGAALLQTGPVANSQRNRIGFEASS